MRREEVQNMLLEAHKAFPDKIKQDWVKKEWLWDNYTFGGDKDASIDAAMTKIDRIENDGFQFKESFLMNCLWTSPNYRNGETIFDPENYQYVMSFENDQGAKRYCILNGNGDVMKESLGKLMNNDMYLRRTDFLNAQIKSAEYLSVAFADLEYQISPRDCFNTFRDYCREFSEKGLDEVPSPQEFAEYVVKEIEKNSMEMPVLAGKNNVNLEHIWFETENAVDSNDTSHMFLNTEKQYGFDFYDGYRVIGDMCQQYMEKRIERGEMITAEMAHYVHRAPEAWQSFKENYYDKCRNNDQKIQVIRMYLASFDNRKYEKVKGQPNVPIEQKLRTPSKSLCDAIINAIDKHPDQIHPYKMGNELIDLDRVFWLSGQHLDFSQEKLQNAETNLISAYLTEPEKGYYSFSWGTPDPERHRVRTTECIELQGDLSVNWHKTRDEFGPEEFAAASFISSFINNEPSIQEARENRDNILSEIHERETERGMDEEMELWNEDEPSNELRDTLDQIFDEKSVVKQEINEEEPDISKNSTEFSFSEN